MLSQVVHKNKKKIYIKITRYPIMAPVETRRYIFLIILVILWAKTALLKAFSLVVSNLP